MDFDWLRRIHLSTFYFRSFRPVTQCQRRLLNVAVVQAVVIRTWHPRSPSPRLNHTSKNVRGTFWSHCRVIFTALGRSLLLYGCTVYCSALSSARQSDGDCLSTLSVRFICSFVYANLVITDNSVLISKVVTYRSYPLF
jgi:hypothetical protein